MNYIYIKMSIYLKTTINYKHLNRIAKCVNDFIKTGNVKNLYYYSIPYGLRKTIFKTLSVPVFTNELENRQEYPFTKFISKTINVFLGKKYFHIKLNHSDLDKLYIVINFLKEHNAEHIIYVDCEFTNSDLNFIQKTIDQFPHRKLYFKLSDIEFSYLEVKDIKDDIIYSETECLLERLEISLPDHYEKDIGFKTFIKNELVHDLDFKRYYRVYDKKLGIISESAMFPRCLEKNSIIILQ